MSEVTPRLKTPYIRASQAQKEITHNTALNILDAVVQAVVVDHTLSSPPGDPDEGAVWIVASDATGAWVGHDRHLAHYIGGAWAFYEPFAGMSVWLLGEQMIGRYTGSDWDIGHVKGSAVYINNTPVLGPRQSAIADVSGGAVVDVEARDALNLLLEACRSHGLIEI